MNFNPPVNLTNCDREPIHIPGTIQPHGALLVCDADCSEILRLSENAATFFGLPTLPLGQTLASVLGEEPARQACAALHLAREERAQVLPRFAYARGGLAHVTLHAVGDEVILEFEPATAEMRHPLSLLQDLIARCSEIEDVDALIDETARLVSETLGYDRVMIYRFGHDGAGKVVSEVKRADLESFYGQYFPASDIPRQARSLYLKNTIRIISDVDCARIAILPEIDAAGRPLDLSHAHLRSVSPIHLEYLRNMGVGASMSISIVIDGALWGLIACHHYSPRILPMETRIAAEMFGQFFSLHLQALKQKRKIAAAAAARKSLDGVVRLLTHKDNIAEILREHLRIFEGFMPCDGVGLWFNGQWTGQGVTPPDSAIAALAAFVGGRAEARVWATHMLSADFPPAAAYSERASGLLVVPLSQRPRDYLFFFRQEVTQTLNWAGNPAKSYETGPSGDRLTPRKSFAIWKETVRQQSVPWGDDDQEVAAALHRALVEVVLRHNELMADERTKADVRQRMLNQELNHRVKNILAVIKSVVGHPTGRNRDLGDYIAALKGRIQALSFAHDQVVRNGGGGFLGDLVRAELTPYRDSAAAIRVSGPGLWLDARAYSVMALVLHELATNAAKYGALSAGGGALSVAWRREPGGDCRLSWTETGVLAAVRPAKSGFGMVLIERSVPYDLGGRSVLSFLPEGLEAVFVLPGRHIADTDQGLPPAEGPGPAPERAADPVAGRKILLVEDQMLIALDVEAMLEDHGAGEVATANSVSAALARLADFTPDVAILDVNLGTDTSIAVAEELVRRAIPFVFATGYGETSFIPEAMQTVAVVRKPYDSEKLIPALAAALGG